MNLVCAPILAGNSYGDQLGDESKLVVQALTNLASGGPDDNEAQAGHLVAFHPAQITSKDNRSNPRPGDPCPTLPAERTGPMVMQCHGSNVGPMGHLRAGNGNVTGGVPFVTHALTGEGFDASEDGTGRGTPLVPIAEVGAKTQMGGGRNGCGIGLPGDPMFTLQAGKQHAVGVRRLTPTECERLQGFPDLWTCLCAASDGRDWSVMRLSDEAVNACTCPDGPRYKTLGNAVTVPVIEWLARRMITQ